MEVKDAVDRRFDVVYYPQEVNGADIVGEKNFVFTAMDEFGYRIARGSAAGIQDNVFYEPQFRNWLRDCSPLGRVVEIGTWRGLSTSLLAHYADAVTTIDIRYYDEAKRLWMWAGLYDKVKQVVVGNNEGKAAYLNRIDFDFAFIDGMHKYDDVAFDFECVKKCGRVLFHDYCPKCPEVMAFVDTLDNVQKDEPFAYYSD